MSKETKLQDGWGRTSKCGGIPMYSEYKFQIDESVEFSEEEVKARKKRLANFLDKYGLTFVDKNCD